MGSVEQGKTKTDASFHSKKDDEDEDSIFEEMLEQKPAVRRSKRLIGTKKTNLVKPRSSLVKDRKLSSTLLSDLAKMITGEKFNREFENEDNTNVHPQVLRAMLSRIPIYNGKGGSEALQIFIKRVEMYMKHDNKTQAEGILSLVSMQLSPAVQSWYDQYKEQNTEYVESWEALKEILATEYIPFEEQHNL